MKRIRGFTLLEVLVSSVIIGIAIIPVSRGMISLIDARLTSQRMTRVTLLAKMKMEETKLAAVQTFSSDYSATGSFDPPYERYRFRVQDDADPEMKTLIVDTWFDEDGDGNEDPDEISISVRTRLTKRD